MNLLVQGHMHSLDPTLHGQTHKQTESLSMITYTPIISDFNWFLKDDQNLET